jgi:hypothetical protein
MQDTRKFLTNASEELELLGTREYSIGIILTGAGSFGKNNGLKKQIIKITEPYELQTTSGSRFFAAFNP